MTDINDMARVSAHEQSPESPSRRAFWRGSSLAAAVTASVAAPTMAKAATTDTQIDDVLHVIQRLTMGATTALYDEVSSMGVDAFIEQQLDPASIDDSETDAMISQFKSAGLSTAEVMQSMKRAPIRNELNGKTVIRAVYSRRQLQEVMTDFWSNHFNVDTYKKNVATFKVEEDRGIRELALTNFHDLLMYSAKSPAMLEYLDNRRSRANRDRVPNENYARELMELHTLGVDGGYSEDDVSAVSYLLSGWSINGAEFAFRANWNRLGPLNDGADIMGWAPFSPEGSVENGESFITFLAYQAATAHFICWKLCRYFIRDDIEQSDPLVAQIAQVFSDNDTEMKPTLRAIFASDDFKASKGLKVKRSNELLYATLRASGASIDLSQSGRFGNHMRNRLEKMDHGIFACEPPTGYPDDASVFINTNTMVNRWNIGFAVAGNRLSKFVRVNTANWIDSPSDIRTLVEQLCASLLLRQLEDSEKQALYDQLGKAPEDVVKRRDLRQVKILAGLIFASASFQIR
ncbi:DUF1800 domain-containing protein [Leucothrix sargassi]|nr:DUF1800 domain-containing protein [Leucothrix sargassi]